MHSPTINKPAQRVSSVAFFEISADQAGQRIDNYLRTRLKGVPKSRIYRMLRTGEVRVNKGRVKQTYRLQRGDVLRIPPLLLPDPAASQKPSRNSLKLLSESILYENKALMVINKPPGMAVHGGSGINFGVIEGLRALYPDTSRLELVHRLDRDTSGCLLIAKKNSMLRYLHALFRDGGIHKGYLGLVKGHWPARLVRVDAPLQKNVLRSGERIVRVNNTGKTALSRFALKQTFAQASLVQVSLVTGRTHQIRVHAAHMGHPLAGDEKYGDTAFNRQMHAYGLNRLFLHAERMAFVLPDTRQRISIIAPVPQSLEQVILRIRN
ncbi:MAG: 23S rRNA pseudouridine(955/2504/2580) synthase RluC [Gammaproteobacteria bacterium]|nr:23S rRNA pseudouridine(955/2504/2580) synthase RluC [Gammaproteobacteria bacterium]